MKRRSLAMLLALALALGLTACGGAAPREKAANGAALYGAADTAVSLPEEAEEAYWDAEMPMETKSAASGGGAANGNRANVPESVKMIYRANLELETTEYEKAQSDIVALTDQLGGYFEEQSRNNYSSGYRSASYTVRVPAAQFETFLRQIGELCRVRYQTQSAENVSERYYDVESRLETEKIKLDRLQELLSRAEAMEDIITLESAISDAEYQIESLSGELRHYDALIDYSTIYVTLQEVYKVTEQDNAPLTFGERIGSAFREGLRDFADNLEGAAAWLAYSWIGILAFAAVAAAAVVLVKRVRAKKPAAGKKGVLGEKEKAVSAEAAEEKAEQ